MQDINIGEKVKEYRLAKGISLRDLSEKAGLSPSMLSQIENNSVNPSINALKGIAGALNIPLFKFFQESETQEDLVVRKGEYRTMGRAGDQVQYQLLTSTTSGQLECCLMDLPAGGSSSDAPRGHNGEEVAYVISGEVDVEMDDRKYHLCEGDAVKIPPQVQHRWLNTSEKETRVIFAVTPPGF